jgi:hypothetical protein
MPLYEFKRLVLLVGDEAIEIVVDGLLQLRPVISNFLRAASVKS